VATTPIEDYGLLSDRHSAALVSRSGSVDWLCFPRFDSPAVFAALLDEQAGSWTIRPIAGTLETSRSYLDGTLVLLTRFTTPTGTVEVTDALATGSTEDPHRLGADAPHLLLRSAYCTEGQVTMALDFRPRPEYGLVLPLLAACPGGVSALGGPALLTLSAPVPLIIQPEAATADFTLTAGQTLGFALRWEPLGGPPPRPLDQAEIQDRLTTTVDAWRRWSTMHQTYTGPWHDLVQHSGRVLQGLSYQPTGAIVAAPTTSLPEEPGGDRNWDYRYAWIRDAAFTMDALWVAACPDEFFTFMTAAAATGWTRTHLQIMYGIGGEHDLSERELPHLSGWRGSRPVRIGNGAWLQPQLDVYGELLDTAARYADQLDATNPALLGFLADLAEAACEVWSRPDHGIWESRGEPRHFLYSKLMCWVALDRALELGDRLQGRARAEAWRTVRDEIREAILDQGFNADAGAFTQSFGSTALDASALMLPITDFLPGDDPRVLATLDAIAARLPDDRGLVYRYHPETGVDGLSGTEGSFLLCTFWLAHAQALAGQLDRARETFHRAASRANDLGLLAEQVDPETGALLGNFPQAFSHIGLVNAAWAIVQAEETAREGAEERTAKNP
jgi:GH15 family glucan-1,4-alpha-glucosidase